MPATLRRSLIGLFQKDVLRLPLGKGHGLFFCFFGRFGHVARYSDIVYDLEGGLYEEELVIDVLVQHALDLLAQKARAELNIAGKLNLFHEYAFPLLYGKEDDALPALVLCVHIDRRGDHGKSECPVIFLKVLGKLFQNGGSDFRLLLEFKDLQDLVGGNMGVADEEYFKVGSRIYFDFHDETAFPVKAHDGWADTAV
jgi:hypothetical protein